MIAVKQFAARHGVTPLRVRQFIAEGRIAGAKKLGRDWFIPERAVIRPPANPRGRRRKRQPRCGNTEAA